MTRSELVKSILKSNSQFSIDEIEAALDCLFETFQTVLSRGERVELRDFGIFSIRKRPARLARNPRTGQIVPIVEKKYLHFKMGKHLRQAINCSS